MKKIPEEDKQKYYTKCSLDQLRWDAEMKLVAKCYNDEIKAEHDGEEYKCTCPSTDKWTKEQCLNWLIRNEL